MMTKDKLKISIPDRNDAPEDLQVTQPEQGSILKESLVHTGVGTRLQEARIASKRSLKHVVSALRIRLVYIQAIEEERYSDLPGSAYAIGFVRSYAEYLGLDHDQIVRDFRAETVNYNHPTDLNFPEPEAKSQTPPVAVAVVSLLVAVILYVSWERWPAFWQGEFPYFGQQTISAPPSTKLSSVDASPDQEIYSNLLEQAEPSDQEVLTNRNSSQNFNQNTDVTSFTQSDLIDSNDPNDPNISPTMQSQNIDSQFSISVLPSDLQFSDDEESDPYAIAEGQAEADLYWNSSVGRFMPRVPLDTAMTDPNVDLSTSEDQNLSKREPKIYGELEADVRIVIEATQDSWVQIRDTDGILLLTRVLFPGDRFRVPDRPGLSLTTGNAGGLEITVDRNSVSPIGPDGAVRRGVILEPDKLLYPDALAVSNGDEAQGIIPFP